VEVLNFHPFTSKKEILMKKSTLLVALLVAPMGIVIAQQGEERPAVYQMLDPHVIRSNWPAVFEFIDHMQGVISVNEYYIGSLRTTLLGSAVISRNFLATKTLLEKYGANPNRPINWQGRTAMQEAQGLGTARGGDNALINLLRQYGARE
jgi:hypothetical protein